MVQPDAGSPPARIVIFGITGDLARRYLLPALAALDDAGRLPKDFEIVGMGRSDMSDDEIRAHLREGAAGRRLDARVVDCVTYVRGEVDDVPAIRQAIDAAQPGDVRESWADVSAAREAIGYEPLVGFEEGLRRTIDAMLGAETARR